MPRLMPSLRPWVQGGDFEMTFKSSFIALLIILMFMIGIRIGSFVFQPKADFGKVIYPSVEVRK